MDERPPVATTSSTITFPSNHFGEITVPEDRVLEFPRGIVGMPEARRFVFVHDEDGVGPFFWLHSVDNPNLVFAVCEPHAFFPTYSVPLGIEEQELLGIENAESGVVCLILVVPEDPSKITANLRGPVIVNVESRRGMQLILAGDDYPVQALIFSENAKGEAECSS